EHNAPLGGDSLIGNAQILLAMAACHRHYYRFSDPPLVRSTVEFLFKQRQADGSFGPAGDPGHAMVTAWVADALALSDPEGFAGDVEATRKWLTDHKATGSPWQQQLSTVLAQVRGDVFPQDLGNNWLQAARNYAADPGTLDAAAGTVLLQLVACQAANIALDAAQGTAEATFSPAQQKGFDWLLSQQQDGKFLVKMGDKSFPDPGFTGLALQALQTKPKALRTKQEQETIEKGLQWLLAGQSKDGSFGKDVVNYVTCVVVGALARWDNPEVKPALLKAQAYILAIQNVESQGYKREDREYGSIGYGSSQRGDLSNLQFALEALRASGLPENHEAFAKAIVFLQRTQNLKSVNDFKGKVPDDDGKLIEVASGDDGGSAYYPGNSPMGYIDLPDGTKVPRSYGSMTYALLKSYTMAGVKPDDARIQAAVKWIQGNWTLGENPGADPVLIADPKVGEKIKYQGLYYYYMVLAQALDSVGMQELATADKDGKPVAVAWRKALRTHLEGLQQQDGTWTNGKNSRWYEGMPLIATAYAMLALERCR
ncbi:MAG TPA: prenyltransferase/squalene oxidase repeat-containing protein, partial [Planctomycetota bacterium]|nr:prenyltransferase/squalene oxidase repeat-containing protein [Planctomycetota bacterium]